VAASSDVEGQRGSGGLAAAIFVVALSLVEMAATLQSWAVCDVGINAAANSLFMTFVGLPLLFAGNALVAGVTLWATGRATRSSSRRRLWMSVTPAVALIFLAFAYWAVVITDASYPDPICPGNVPPWVPSWVPS
jgi:hypothetical protein